MKLSPEFLFVLAALITWRVTHLLVEEDGPADLVVRLRVKLGDSLPGRAMDCFYCTSLWIAALAACIGARDLFAWSIEWVALSGAACLLERATASHAIELASQRVQRAEESHGLLRRETSGVANAVDSTSADRSRGADPVAQSDANRASR